MGLFPGEIDLGWWLIQGFAAIGLASEVKTPADLPERTGLRRLPSPGARAIGLGELRA
jgi:hypothetical protein